MHYKHSLVSRLLVGSHCIIIAASLVGTTISNKSASPACNTVTLSSALLHFSMDAIDETIDRGTTPSYPYYMSSFSVQDSERVLKAPSSIIKGRS